MGSKLRYFFTLLFWRNDLNSSAKWFDKNQPAQDRFWELEDWCEELEERIIKLEQSINENNNLNDKINSK
jgi:hypothetical protein